MRNQSILRCAHAGAVGCGLASAAVAIQNTQPMKDHPDWGYTIYGLPGKQTAYVFTNQNATLSWKAPSDVSSVRLLVVGGGGAGGGKYYTEEKDGGYGGGGGGGFTAVDLIGVTPGDTYDIVVGKGGVADKSRDRIDEPSSYGGRSSFVGAGVEARADGGGYGGGGMKKEASYSVGGNGACGGGGGFYWDGTSTYKYQENGGSAEGNGKGFAGGKSGGASSTKRRAGGGGGGAGGAGSTPTGGDWWRGWYWQDV